jgi:signal transduction histidine kinase/ActR/RegA family two-component response regulator
MLTAARRSLRAKVVIVVMLTTLAALAVSASALLVYETRTYSTFLLDDAGTLADLLADITAPALAFDDAAAAQTNLELLSSRQEVSAAAVYSANGELFARYARSPDESFPPLGPPGSTVDGRTLVVFEPVVQNDEVLGTVYVRSSFPIGDQVMDYILILIGVMMASLAVAALMSLWLAGSVTGPLQALTEVARHVVERRDFTRRARRTTNDEIGVFVDAFNTMLAEVGARAADLEASNEALRQETEERRHAEIALRRADQAKDEFLATLAHELRNPLAPMVNAITLLEAPIAAKDVTTRAHGILRRQLTQMVRLVDDLLDVSRITSGKLVVRKQTVELSQVVQNAVDTARPLLDERRQTIAVWLPNEPVYLQADPVRLAQVFSNLLNNAAKYSSPGMQIGLRAAVEGGSVRIRVEDKGAGIGADELGRIFEMFSQGTSSGASQSGLGVGLALAKRLVELHGGNIVAESPGVGRGSVFTVTLPAMAALAASRSVSNPAPSARQARRILLVDDNVDFATSLSFLLQSVGHQVGIAHNANAALAVARELKPEIGFLDLGLPDVSGYELARALRTQPETANTLLVAVSGWGQQRDRERSREAGFALHLVKPVELTSIENVIATLDTASKPCAS